MNSNDYCRAIDSIEKQRVTNVEQSVVQELECGICLGILREAVNVYGCSHLFCRVCISKTWEGLPSGGLFQCAICRNFGNSLENNVISDKLVKLFTVNNFIT